VDNSLIFASIGFISYAYVWSLEKKP